MMNPDKDREFDQSMSQLLTLLKKLLKNVPKGGTFTSPDKDQAVNLNLFFTFFPITPEEMDELEEIYEHYFFQEDKNQEEFSSDLNQSDLDFLKRNGIQF